MAKLDSLPTEIILHVAQCTLVWSSIFQADFYDFFLPRANIQLGVQS